MDKKLENVDFLQENSIVDSQYGRKFSGQKLETRKAILEG